LGEEEKENERQKEKQGKRGLRSKKKKGTILFFSLLFPSLAFFLSLFLFLGTLCCIKKCAQ